jgi:hypothetical protein
MLDKFNKLKELTLNSKLELIPYLEPLLS